MGTAVRRAPVARDGAGGKIRGMYITRLLTLVAFISPLALSASAAGCILDPGGGSCICTLEYRYLTVKVVDAAGAPVTGLTPVVTLVRTGEVIVPQGGGLGGNTYVVLTDGEQKLIRPSGDSIRFAATNSAGTALAYFIIGLTPCDCHVVRVSGPEQIVLQ